MYNPELLCKQCDYHHAVRKPRLGQAGGLDEESVILPEETDMPGNLSVLLRSSLTKFGLHLPFNYNCIRDPEPALVAENLPNALIHRNHKK